MPNIIDDQEQFFQELAGILEQLNDRKIVIEDWFANSLKPFMLLNNHNFLGSVLAIKALIDTRGENNSLYRLNRVLELIHDWASTSPNADIKFLVETARFSHSEDSIPVELINSIMNIVQRPGNIAGGDIIKLHRIYNSPNPPSVAFLRSPDVLHHLIVQTFSPRHPIGYQKEKLWLIAYAAFWNRSSTCKQDLLAGNQLLIDLDRLFERVTSMNQIQDHIMTFMDMINEPVCAAAVIIWLKAKLFDDGFYEWIQFSQGESPFAFHILDEIAVLHPSQRNSVLEIWASLFEREFDLGNDFRELVTIKVQYRERFLDRFVHLFQYYHEKPVLLYLVNHVDSIDPVYVIYFLDKILPDIEMPIDTELYGLMIQMLKNADKATLSGSQTVARLLASGNHMELSEEISKMQQHLEALLV